LNLWQILAYFAKIPVGVIGENATIVQGVDQVKEYSVIVDEAKAIVTHLSRDGLTAQ